MEEENKIDDTQPTPKSENILKAVILNLHRKESKRNVEKLLAKSAVGFLKVQKVPNKAYAVIDFETLEDRDKCIEELNGTTYHNAEITVQIENEKYLKENSQKRDLQSRDVEGNKRRRTHKVLSAADAVTPFHSVPYEDQLQKKSEALLQECVMKLVRRLKKTYAKRLKERAKDPNFAKGRNIETPKWVDNLFSQHNPRKKPQKNGSSKTEDSAEEVNFQFGPIVRSPVIDGYRNKCDFTFGFPLRQSKGAEESPTDVVNNPNDDATITSANSENVADGEQEKDSQKKEPILGFRLGSYKSGNMAVDPPDECPNVSQEMKDFCKFMQSFVRTSPFPIYNQFQHQGVWRLVTLRTAAITQQRLVTVMVSLKDILPDQEDAWKVEKARLESEVRSNSPCQITSLCLQVYDGLSSPEPDDRIEEVFGGTTIIEELNGLTFQISPTSFFQTNTAGAEVLYQKVADMCVRERTDGRKTKVLDICCGTGTIGICCAKKLGDLVDVEGIDMVPSAIEDAKKNAERNGVENANFVCAKAEDVLQKLCEDLDASGSDDEIVAIVDPPRSGLHPKCLHSIRNCIALDRLIYVSCNPTKSMVSDLEIFCGPESKKFTGPAFQPVLAVPVDLFPHTEHCEMIMLLER